MDGYNDAWSPVTKVLVNEGHAVPYSGQSKDDIQEAHIANRERLIAEGIITI